MKYFMGKKSAKKEKEVWEKPRPNIGKPKKLTAAEKAKAMARAIAKGRTYPNLVDNMWALKERRRWVDV